MQDVLNRQYFISRLEKILPVKFAEYKKKIKSQRVYLVTIQASDQCKE
jgi:hypothetical protein